MKFVVHDHYNNSIHPADAFELVPPTGNYPPEFVRITQSGIAFFTTGRFDPIKERLSFLRNLNAVLRSDLGTSISAATTSNSECVVPGEVDAFFDAAKEIGAKTIALNIEGYGFLGLSANANKADHCFAESAISRGMIEALNPGEADRAIPQEGWEAYSDRLSALVLRVMFPQGPR